MSLHHTPEMPRQLAHVVEVEHFLEQGLQHGERRLLVAANLQGCPRSHLRQVHGRSSALGVVIMSESHCRLHDRDPEALDEGRHLELALFHSHHRLVGGRIFMAESLLQALGELHHGALVKPPAKAHGGCLDDTGQAVGQPRAIRNLSGAVIENESYTSFSDHSLLEIFDARTSFCFCFQQELHKLIADFGLHACFMMRINKDLA